MISTIVLIPLLLAQDPAPAPEQPAQPAVDWGLRTHVYLKKLVSLQAFYETVPGTLFDHARNFPRDWGRTGAGFSERLASQYGQFLISESIEFGMSALHKEDPRYFRAGDGRFTSRLGHALKTAVIVPNTSGGQTLAVGRIAGVFGSWAIATRWNPPEQQTAGQIILYGSVGLGFKASSNVWREFWPDIRRRLHQQ